MYFVVIIHPATVLLSRDATVVNTKIFSSIFAAFDPHEVFHNYIIM